MPTRDTTNDQGVQLDAAPQAQFDQETATRGSAAATRPAAVQRTWRTRTVAGIGLCAFLAGALFWHFVGFWTFVSGIVFNSETGDLVATTRPVDAADRVEKKPVPRADDVANGADQRTSRPTKPPAGIATPRIATTETLADLLQCTQARKAEGPSLVQACPPLRERLPVVARSSRGNRQLDAREAATRLAKGWSTGISQIETGSLPKRN